MLVISIFCLEGVLATPRPSARRGRCPWGVQSDGEPILCDSDGFQSNLQRGGQNVSN